MLLALQFSKLIDFQLRTRSNHFDFVAFNVSSQSAEAELPLRNSIVGPRKAS
jgi:hypothetical protein